MGWWLRALSVAFVALGTTFGACVVLKGTSSELLHAQAKKLQPMFGEIVEQGNSALKLLFETSRVALPPSQRLVASRQTDHRKSHQGQGQPGSHFAVSSANSQKSLPAHAPTVLPQSVHPNEVSELRLTQSAGQQAMDLSPVESRLRKRVPQEVLRYFDLVLYISKAADDQGSWAQKMFVLARTETQAYELEHNWPVSTGMERLTLAPSGSMVGTHTPEGAFQLDRNRSFKDYTSRQWKSTMPYAMFFDWQFKGRVSGLAIHGSDEKDEADLGKRASHGCIRLATPNARVLFDMIMSQYKGRVPRFHIDPETKTMSTKGALALDATGNPMMSSGYKVLVFIEDYGGPANDAVAALF